MEKSRRSQILAIVALLLAVGGLSLGFAAFTQTLNIKSSAAVSPDQSSFNVIFTDTAGTGTSVTPTLNPTGVTNFTADMATINNNNHDITGLKANFTEPGQTVTYTFMAKNSGELLAYLNGVTFNNVTGESSAKICTPGSGTTASLVAAACDDISISVQVGSSTFTASDGTVANHTLAVAASETVEVTIAYAAGGDRADGDFTVAFGDVSLLYGSVD